ncbi:MAG TPA: sulfite exporter TauE/SafE family protein [Candidatus Sabulitectum sp.]|nr:sulfite exporter TauE/SafE family protein [Candidatus Sabulitectum sp.]HPF32557.1 sulfite exporter TauE/SafE family protein [Candidatus Sabulitectum sp.]HPJ27459.1 sulfite exporter TauE/SafE family protein [Candidatus Sabulitectum sp.]HPR21316.1 sulfite exporter TauE/SafE family protein [Candidatus Sabulitectum sp.]
MELELLALLFGMAFLCELVDSTLGMGYGTTLTPVLLLMGYEPTAIVPAILLSELITGGFAAFAHHRAGNAYFDFRNDTEHSIVKKMGKLGYLPRSQDSRIAFILGLCSLVGAAGAAVFAVNLKAYLTPLIGVIVLAMGVLILARHKSPGRFSWRKVTGLGITAAFNKGLSGGGYGPLVTSGQILSGVNGKSAIAITSMAESFTCLVGVLTYLILGTTVNWELAPPLVVGAVASVPLSAVLVKRMNTRKFTLVIGVATTALGLLTLYKAFF